MLLLTPNAKAIDILIVEFRFRGAERRQIFSG